MAEFLESMGFVAKAFGMHLPNQQAQNKPTLKDAQVLVAKNATYLNEMEREIQASTGKKAKPKGSYGCVSPQTIIIIS